jgi:phosphoglycolate phosphatase-like HAD superfamily hydrolase
MPANGHRLVLFDIDGTLLSAGRASREALRAAFQEAWPEEIPLDGYDFSGKTDPQIVRELLGPHVPAGRVAEISGKALDLYVGHLERRLRPGEVVVKKGVAELLPRLAKMDPVTQGLLTGNLERGARIKLSPAGLNSFFGFGAFGSDHADRYELPAIALARAYEATRRVFSGKEIVIVGDSIHDVACGRAWNVRSIAVATGLTSADRLAGERPDFLFPDLSDTERIIEAMVA